MYYIMLYVSRETCDVIIILFLLGCITTLVCVRLLFFIFIFSLTLPLYIPTPFPFVLIPLIPSFWVKC